MKRNQKLNGAVMLFLLACSSGLAELKVASIFGNDMVLQQNAVNPLWGWADAGETVTITATWLDDPVTVTAGRAGEWKAGLPVPAADLKAHSLTVRSDTSITADNIIFGDVWICSGQSNMAMPLRGNINEPVFESQKHIVKSANPHIRQFRLRFDRHDIGVLGYRVAKVRPLLLREFEAHSPFVTRHPRVDNVVHREEIRWTHQDLVAAHCFFSISYVLKKPNGSQSPDSRSI